MELEKQVVNLELSKRLKKLGVKQNSLFYWCEWTMDRITLEYVENPDDFVAITGGSMDRFSAFTVAELGEMLPRSFDYEVSEFGVRDLIFSSGRTIIENNGWYVMYNDPHPSNKIPVYAQHADTEANARAKMLIYLLENKLITLN